MTNLEIGMAAPEFCLPDADEEMACLSEHSGEYVVVYFYPRDNSSACTLEARSFSDELESFERENIPVYGISPDSTTSHKRFSEKQELSVRLLSDPEHRVIESYGVWVSKKMYGKEYMGVERSTFIIDPDGKIAHIWRKVKVKGHVEDVLNRLRELKAEGGPR
ncbi:MAG: thioredoxin-dependent thiol peroxidase [Methanocalculus sp. MSAO_Arc2]|uniref:thioredoxin-dependent thiol peroxidase n=1 Tax=Methanocalculus sp. MSAO_Arc2 TaxID=2293855 RepID=UPI000FF149D6|nr:MAG: thioredoxin-dependent thiol peroxidase [Methanocalculus sp. MSAO_Arc2]